MCENGKRLQIMRNVGTSVQDEVTCVGGEEESEWGKIKAGEEKRRESGAHHKVSRIPRLASPR